jgi:hypothetical protein
MILAVHETSTLTQERYEEVVQRLTGRPRIESPGDLPFGGLLVRAAGEGPNGFSSSMSSSPRRRWKASAQRWGQFPRRLESSSRRSSSQRTPSSQNIRSVEPSKVFGLVRLVSGEG